MSKEEPWVVLSGCNECINKKTCDTIGSCVMLIIDKEIPEFNKRKRRLIDRIRNGGSLDATSFITKEDNNNSTQPVRLTVFEKAAIESLNKKRYKDEDTETGNRG